MLDTMGEFVVNLNEEKKLGRNVLEYHRRLFTVKAGMIVMVRSSKAQQKYR